MSTREIFLIICSLFVLILAEEQIFRLPKYVKPIRYILAIEPFLEGTYFNGNVTIEITAMENTDKITFHDNSLNISLMDIKIIDSNGKETKINNGAVNISAEMYTIFLENSLRKGEDYNLTINNFSHTFGYLGGFMKRSYNDSGARSAITIATHFEPTGARSTFPCFDEPTFKAKFLISLIRPEGYLSISNEALEKTEDLGNGRFKDTFKETPMMPTYTVAFIVTNFSFLETPDKQRIFSTPWVIENGELDMASEVGFKSLAALEKYTGINYTLSKIDQVVIPHFPSAGMENWGLITYSDIYLKITNTSEADELQLMTLIVAHEFCHQWFGNLVTPEWWEYLWLSEGFSAYFQYVIASTIQPSWRLMEQMVVDGVKAALHEEDDTYPGSLNEPIRQSGALPTSYIMYQKASAIIRMMEHFLTPTVFKNGVQIYLQNMKFKSATPSDLYSAFQNAVDDAGANGLLGNFSVADVLTTWDSTAGFPIVTVTRNYTNGAITLTQKASTNETTRIIPINYVFSNDVTKFTTTVADYWLNEESATINKNFPADGWVIINIQQNGYYRVNYDLENWELIIDYLNSANYTSIHVLNRAQLIDDAFYLASKNMVPWSIPLRLGAYLIRERDYIPFATFCVYCKEYLDTLTEATSADEYKNFEKYVSRNTISDDYATKTVATETQYIKTVLSGIEAHLGPDAKLDEIHLDKLTRIKLRRCYEEF